MSDDRSFEIGEKKFKLNKMDVFKQAHTVRRLAPILAEMIPVANKLSSLKADQEMGAEQYESLVPLMNGIAKLSDADFELVLKNLLGCVELQHMGSWSRVATEGGGIMFSDMELPLLLQIAARAFMYNMKGFFFAMPQVSGGQKLV